MANTKKFSKKWWIKRIQAHDFMKNIYEKKDIKYKKNFDYVVTKLITDLFER